MDQGYQAHYCHVVLYRMYTGGLKGFMGTLAANYIAPVHGRGLLKGFTASLSPPPPPLFM